MPENQPKPTLLERLSTLTRALTARNSLSQQQCRTLGEVAEALERVRVLEEQIARMEELRAEYHQEEWSEPLDYQQQMMDLPPYLYAWGNLDSMMSHAPAELERNLGYLAEGHVKPQYVLLQHQHAMGLYRHIIRTLMTRAALAQEGGR